MTETLLIDEKWQKAVTIFGGVVGTQQFAVYALNRIPQGARGPQRFLLTAAALAPSAAYAAYEAVWGSNPRVLRENGMGKVIEATGQRTDTISKVSYNRTTGDLTFNHALADTSGRWWTLYQGPMPSYDNYKEYMGTGWWWRFKKKNGTVTSEGWSLNSGSLYTLALFNGKWDLADFETFTA